MPITLYSYYRSSCSWRVRLALELKGIPYEIQAINLLKDEQSSVAYLELNPSGCVPYFIHDNVKLSQSIAILEYLEEVFKSQCKLLPEDAVGRAQVRRLVQVIATDCQPIQNLWVLKEVGKLLSWSDEQCRREWGGLRVIKKALIAYDLILQEDKERTEGYSYGNRVSLADITLIPQLYNARRFGIDVELEFPRLASIEETIKANYKVAYENAHPDSQPDNPLK